MVAWLIENAQNIGVVAAAMVFLVAVVLDLLKGKLDAKTVKAVRGVLNAARRALEKVGIKPISKRK